jgi:hypothetical protein
LDWVVKLDVLVAPWLCMSRWARQSENDEHERPRDRLTYPANYHARMAALDVLAKDIIHMVLALLLI